LVYSAHDYGPVESGQPWFTPQMTEASLAEVWRKHWGYISQEGIAPVWLGEFGYVAASSENPTPAESLEALWFRGMIRYLSENPFLHWTYWSLNGADRYGLLNLKYDATPRDSSLQDALTRIQFPLGIGVKADRVGLAGHDGPREPDTVVEVVPPVDASKVQCRVDYTNVKDWQQGFTGGITIHNTGKAAIEGWKLTWTFVGDQKIGQLWSGNYAQTGRSVTLTNLGWNATIPAGGEVSGIGFNAAYTGENLPPAKFYLNGSLCK
jgi:endoglucanase